MSPLRPQYRIICLIIFLIPMVLFAQDKKVRKGVKNPEISAVTRINSAQYADGLREFYSKNYTVSEETFRAIINQDSKNDAAYFMLSRIKEEQKDYTGAIGYITQAIELNDQNIWYQVALANLYDQIGDYKNSEKVWKKVCNSVTNNEYYLYSLSNALLKNEKYEEVIKTFDKMEEIIGMNEELTDTKKNIWLYLNQVEKAVQEYKRWIQLYPHEMKNYITIAQIYNVNGMPKKAIEILEQAEAIDSNNIYIISAFITVYKSTKQKTNESYYTYLLMQQKEQDNIIFQILKERTQAIIKNNEVNILDQGFYYELEQYCKKNPENGGTFGLLSQLCYFAKNDNKALEYSALAIQYNDISFETWNIYLRLLYKESKYQEIIQKANDVEILFPTQSHFSLICGSSFLQSGDTLNAKKWFNNCLTYSSDDLLSELVSESLGDIYFSENNLSEALKHWKMSQRYGNNSSKLIEKINQLQ